MLCGVTATLGSNPSATATAARPHWGRAVLLCLRGVLCRCVAVWPHGCSGRRRDRPLCVPVGGGPPARRPRCELRSARRLEARPGPAAAHRHRGRSLRHPPHQRGWVADVCLCVVSKPNQAPPPPINFARNSPAACSNIEFASLELQRFGVCRKMTTINYVRNLGGGGVVAARGRRRQVRGLFEAAPPGIRQRRDPEGSRLSLRAVAVPPAPETQRPSLSSETTVAVESGANAQFFHQPLTVSMACVPRSDSAEWALTRPEDRRAAWKREATFSQFTRFHQALT